MPLPPLRMSISAGNAYVACQQVYAYRYYLRLTPKVPKVSLERGTLIHRYLQLFYDTYPADKVHFLDPEDAHYVAREQAIKEYAPYCDAYRAAAEIAGNEKAFNEYTNLLPAVERICDRYYLTRGRDDVERYEIMAVEHWLDMPLDDQSDIRTVGKLDLLLWDPEYQHVHLVDHKTTTQIPEDGRMRMRDLQTLMYAQKLEAIYGIKIASVWWNYINTSEPAYDLFNQPTKAYPAGPPSRAKAATSTWAIFTKAMAERGYDPDEWLTAQVAKPDYPKWVDLYKRLQRAELKDYFPRYEHVMVVQPRLLLEDYISIAREIQYVRSLWATGQSRPRRSSGSRLCDFCEFRAPCTAALTGGDEAGAIADGFTQRGSDSDPITEDVAKQN